MPFNSLNYSIFLPVVLLLTVITPQRTRWVVLMLGSFFFYATVKEPILILALLLVTVASYVGGRCLVGQAERRWGSVMLWAFIGFDLLILIALKYFPHKLSTTIVTVVGVSYFVFQAISYVVDVYAGLYPPEKHFGYLALYLAFFPKLLQGPIERAGDLLPQLHSIGSFEYEKVRTGLLMFAWGLFKKLVIADRLGFYVDSVYDDVHSHTGLALAAATCFYAAQIYYDFSGYTDMALGSAHLLGIQLTQNFRSPYLASSIPDFWRRWHISFSRWILDYIFKPLQMTFRSIGTAGTALALFVTFLACGLWHGGRSTFVVWGLLHGAYMAVSVLSSRLRTKITNRLSFSFGFKKVWQIPMTFALVCFAWIFFRANAIDDALYVVSHLFSGTGKLHEFLLMRGWRDLSVVVGSVLIVTLISYWDAAGVAGDKVRNFPVFFRWSVYYALIAALLFLSAQRGGYFIYFQF
jgi:alginate O-acetyltransferase complex protein AlgI